MPIPTRKARGPYLARATTAMLLQVRSFGATEGESFMYRVVAAGLGVLLSDVDELAAGTDPSNPPAPRAEHVAEDAVKELQFIVAFAFELEQAEAMAEGVVQQRKAAIRMLTRRCLENGTGSERSSDGCVEVCDDEVQVQGHPVSSVASELLRPFEGLGTRGFEQQIDWSFCPQQFDKSALETPTDAERKRLRIESDGAL